MLEESESESKAEKQDRVLINAWSRLMKTTQDQSDKDTKYFMNCSKDTLTKLCGQLDITFSRGENKIDLVKKLLAKQIESPQEDILKGLVLDEDMVQEIDADIAKMVLPSWVVASPSKFGSSEHGKLKADEWRTMASI
ncbi:hypothetical protein K439DRAFT_1623040 [Ramaria rubella]|nr:hypothetical protein K439DRAFT_1623040 [Ramaria rubella]